MDPHEGCAIGGLRGITKEVLAEREKHVFEWCNRRGLPIAFVPAGGYVSFELDEAALVGLHRLTVEQAAARWQVAIDDKRLFFTRPAWEADVWMMDLKH
jgi:hypothetical protein